MKFSDEYPEAAKELRHHLKSNKPILVVNRNNAHAYQLLHELLKAGTYSFVTEMFGDLIEFLDGPEFRQDVLDSAKNPKAVLVIDDVDKAAMSFLYWLPQLLSEAQAQVILLCRQNFILDNAIANKMVIVFLEPRP